MSKTPVKRKPNTPAARTRKPVINPNPVLTKVEPTEEKATNQILMLAADDKGMTFYINRASAEFFVPLDDPNYAAMTSVLLSAHAAGAVVAVKYMEPAIGQLSNRRRALAVAKGVHGVISGASF